MAACRASATSEKNMPLALLQQVPNVFVIDFYLLLVLGSPSKGVSGAACGASASPEKKKKNTGCLEHVSFGF